jgi:hypothetical protein
MAGPSALLQKGRWTLSPYGRDINTFVDGCKLLLNTEIVAAELTPQQNQVIQYYLAALVAKFPALLK